MALEADLKQRCDMLADHLRSKKLASEVEIKACFEQPDSGELGAALVYGDLRALHAERAVGSRPKGEQADRIILDALRGASKVVSLTEPIEEIREVSVYPKSLNAIIELAERDAVMGLLQAAVDALKELTRQDAKPEHIDHLARAIRELSYQQRLCVWIVIHPGPGLPFPEQETNPTLPAWLSYLSPWDALQIFTAHEEVNAGRLAALQALPRGKKRPDDSSRGWGVYLANLAALLNRGAEQLARDHSLAALFAQSYVHGVEQERALEKAER